MRTHVLVGLGAALFTPVSIYGFSELLDPSLTPAPSRVAAGIVAGIGFLGAGVIFVRQNVVEGLTTAASIWVTAAIGMASAAGMVVIAILGTALYLSTVSILDLLARRVRRPYGEQHVAVVTYNEDQNVLREVPARSTGLDNEQSRNPQHAGNDRVESEVRGSQETLVERLGEINGMISVQVVEDDD